ncbi:MAG TPA: nitrogenase component 1 [Armatimonadota bacterium]|nr:nitrogenase component 1 [Armatimonadota bacterium]
MSKTFIERPRYLCALGGAMGTAIALPRTIPILHAAGGCAGNITWAHNGGSGLQVGGYCGALHVPSSNVQEREVIFGGDSRLHEEIENALRIMDGDLYFVLTGCVTEVIGDDVRAVVQEFVDDGAPIISASTGGFRGNSYYGYDLVLQALIRQYIKRGVPVQRGTVNLWGVVPCMDAFWRGNLEGVRGLLESLGLKVQSFFLPGDTLEGIQNAASAELNIVISDIYGVEAAHVFEQVHGTPSLISPLPVGPTATDAFLRAVAGALALDQRQVDDVIQRENARYYAYLDPLIDPYYDLDLQRYAVVVADANYSVALTRFLIDDLGWLPELVVCTDQVDETQQETLRQRLLPSEAHIQPAVVFDTDGSEAINHLYAHWPQVNDERYAQTFSPAFVIGSSFERELATKLGAPHLSVSFPVANRAIIDRGYTGYSGGLRLIEDLLSAIVAGR